MIRRLARHLHMPDIVARMALVIVFIGLLLAITLVSQETDAAPLENDRPNIIFIIFDALRADHVSAYGYPRQTTPVVDSRLAGKGVLFSEATALSSWTKPSNASMLASMLPSELFDQWEDIDGPVSDSSTLLAEYLHDSGYTTAGFIDIWYLREQFGFTQGFDTYEVVGVDGDSINNLTMAWLDQNGYEPGNDGGPLFLYLYYYDPHSWYDPPPPFDTMFDPDYTGSLTPESLGHLEDVVSGDLILSARDLEYLIALYDGDIAYSDHLLDLMLDDLERRGLLENSLIVLSSDHGEMFGEHDKWVHHNSLYEEVLRVPLMFRYSGVLPKDVVFDEPVDHLDVTPTILDLVQIPIPSHMAGRSLVPLMTGAQPSLPERPIYAQMAGVIGPDGAPHWIAPPANMYAIKEGGDKLIHTERMSENDRLYNVENASIYEQENIIDLEPEKAEALWQKLQGEFDIPTEFLFMPVVERP